MVHKSIFSMIISYFFPSAFRAILLNSLIQSQIPNSTFLKFLIVILNDVYQQLIKIFFIIKKLRPFEHLIFYLYKYLYCYFPKRFCQAISFFVIITRYLLYKNCYLWTNVGFDNFSLAKQLYAFFIVITCSKHLPQWIVNYFLNKKNCT